MAPGGEIAGRFISRKIIQRKESVLENDSPTDLKLGWSDFARNRYHRNGGHTWFSGTDDELLARVRTAWPQRRPGKGRSDLASVVVVPVDPAGFVGSTVLVDKTTSLRAVFEKRQPQEEGHVSVLAAGDPEPVRHAAVVLYSAAALLENGGTRSGDFDWEVVALIAAAVEDPPLDPVTMARNMLAKTGGTFTEYSARDFAEAIWYWRRRARKD
jgi:hypothetical protein